MYKLTPELAKGEGMKFIDVGIHENLELKRIDKQGNELPPVEYNVSENGNEFLAFYFTDQDGNQLIKTEWKPSDTDQVKLDKKIVNQMKRVQAIITCFISLQEYVMQVDSFQEFAKRTIELLSNKYKGKKVRVKAVYAYNNFVSLPNYTFQDNPFIESMDISKAESKMKITSMDKMVRDDKPDTTTSEKNPFETQSASDSTTDLPF